MARAGYVLLTEEITFLPDGGSRHVLRGETGGVLDDVTYPVSPVLFQKRGSEWGMETAKERGVVSVRRVVERPKG